MGTRSVYTMKGAIAMDSIGTASSTSTSDVADTNFRLLAPKPWVNWKIVAGPD